MVRRGCGGAGVRGGGGPGRRAGRAGACLAALVALALAVALAGCAGEGDGGRDGQAPDVPAADAAGDGVGQASWYAEIPEGVPVVDFRSDPDDPSSTENFRQAQARLEELIRAFTPEIYVIGLDFSWDYLDTSLFWVGDAVADIEFTYVPDDSYGSTYHGTLELAYNCAPEDVPGMQAQVDAVAAEILALIPEGADDWTKALTVHDELVRRVTYDPQVKAGTGEGSAHCHDIYGALVEGDAVCMGYAYAFDYLCRQAGVTVDLLLTDDGSHIYTAFAMRQGDVWSWCYVDPTWADHDTADAYGNAYVDHSYFGVSEEEIERYDSHEVSLRSFINYDAASNWYVRTGNYLYDAGYGSILAAFGRQYGNGSNCLEVRFDTDELYRQACADLFGDDCAMLNAILADCGYQGAYSYWYNDVAKTVEVGLNP